MSREEQEHYARINEAAADRFRARGEYDFAELAEELARQWRAGERK